MAIFEIYVADCALLGLDPGNARLRLTPATKANENYGARGDFFPAGQRGYRRISKEHSDLQPKPFTRLTYEPHFDSLYG